MLRARSISTVVIGPHARPNTTFDLGWDRLSAVAIGYGFSAPDLDRVVHDHYASMVRILTECERHGFRRIGIVLNALAHHRTKRMITAAYWSRLESQGFMDVVPPLIVDDWKDHVFKTWFRKHRPEVVIVTRPVQALVQAGLAGSETCLISVNAEKHGEVSGIFRDHAGIGATAARAAIAKAFRNECGVPAAAQIVLTSGVWNEGRTLRFADGDTAADERSA
jgi:hypothetical protein